ncbi:MAG: T9SS type A sorting domain-containing protein, partial [Methanococcaceae archaeon]
TKTLIEEKNLSSKMPNEYCLKQNYPNPFNPLTVIRYGLPKTSRVKIKIFNSIGKEVDVLVNDVKNAGYHEMIWNASRNASGVYFCTIEAISEDGENSFKSASKLILMK